MNASTERRAYPAADAIGWAALYALAFALTFALGMSRTAIPAMWLPIGVAVAGFVALKAPWWPLFAALALGAGVAAGWLAGGDVPFAILVWAADIMVGAASAIALRRLVKSSDLESASAISILGGLSIAGGLLWAVAVGSGLSLPLDATRLLVLFASPVQGVMLAGIPLVARDRSGSGFGTPAARRESAILFATAALFALAYGAPYLDSPPLGHLIVAASTPVISWAAMRRGVTVALAVLLIVKLGPLVMFLIGLNPLGKFETREFDLLAVQLATLFVGIAALMISAVPAGRFGMLAQTRVRAKLLSAIEETSPDAVVTIDSHGIVQSFSAAGERLFGYARDEVEGYNVSMLMPPHFRAEHDGYIARYLRTGEKRIVGIGRVVAGQRKDGTTFPVELAVGESSVDGSPLFVGFIRDLTAFQREQRRAQELQQQLFHVSRLTEMGQIASGLVHEVNQPLAAIMNYLQASRQQIANAGRQASDPIDPMLAKAEASAKRAAEIVKRLRAFIDRREVERRQESLNAMIEESLALGLVGPAGKAVGVRLELANELPPVCVDRVQIQQVIVNLVRNAVDAMSGHARREMRIVSALEPDGTTRVSVADTGPGVAPEVADQLFGAFVTTKAEGMGVGLSICKAIIENHGGKIWFTPNDGPGTTFHFTLPAYAAD